MPPLQHETSQAAIRGRFEEICLHYRSDLEIRPAGIMLCSEMRGFCLVDERGVPVTEYMGWLDERSSWVVWRAWRPATQETRRSGAVREGFRFLNGM